MKLSPATCGWMQHLAARYVPNGRGAHHVVDPCLDMRDRFADLVTLKRELDARGLNVDVLAVANDYGEWWKLFRSILRIDGGADRANSVELKRKLRGALLERSNGLIDALRLPNALGDEVVLALADKSSDSHSFSSPPIDSLFSPPNDRFEAFRRARNWLSALVREHFPRSAIHFAPPAIVRPALIEACNLDLRRFPIVRDGNNLFCITGLDLPNFIACFVKKSLGISNEWPVCLFASGEKYAYDALADAFRQRSVFCFLNFYRTLDEERACRDASLSILRHLSAKISPENCPTSAISHIAPPQLKWYERAAVRLSHKAKCLARYSSIGDYVSRRIHFTFDCETTKKQINNFVGMSFVKIDLNTIVDN